MVISLSSLHFIPSHHPSIRCETFFFCNRRREREKKHHQNLNNSVFRVSHSAASQLMSSKYRCTHQLLQAVAWPKVPSALRHAKICTCERETLWPKMQLKLASSHSFQRIVFISVLCSAVHSVSLFTALFTLMPDIARILQICQNSFRDNKTIVLQLTSVKKQRYSSL